MHPGLVAGFACCSPMHPGLVASFTCCSPMHPGLIAIARNYSRWYNHINSEKQDGFAIGSFLQAFIKKPSREKFYEFKGSSK